MEKIYDLIENELLVREPVDEICDKIISSQNKKIILTGGRGVGKTTILSALESRGLGTKNQCIGMRFDAVGFGCEFEQKFYTHYYELIFCNKVLHYIRENYSLTYNKYFEEHSLIIYTYLEQLNNYINNFLYENIKINRYFNTGELLIEIINKFKEVLKLETLTLAIDRFDWTLQRNPIAQKVLSKYFDMFDKIIITSDEEELKEKEGYSIISVTYGKDIEVIKEIIKKYVLSYDSGKSGYDMLPYELINDETYLNLYGRTNGNIKLMLEILKEVIRNWEWNCNGFDIEEEFRREIEYKKENFKQLKMMAVKPKLYL